MYGFDARRIPHCILYANVWKGVFSILAGERDMRTWEAEKMTAVRIQCFIVEEHLRPPYDAGADAMEHRAGH